MIKAIAGQSTIRDRLDISARRLLGPLRKYAGFALNDGRMISAAIEGRIELPGYGWVDGSTFTIPQDVYWMRTPVVIRNLSDVRFDFNRAVLTVKRDGYAIRVDGSHVTIANVVVRLGKGDA